VPTCAWWERQGEKGLRVSRQGKARVMVKDRLQKTKTLTSPLARQLAITWVDTTTAILHGMNGFYSITTDFHFISAFSIARVHTGSLCLHAVLTGGHWSVGNGNKDEAFSISTIQPAVLIGREESSVGWRRVANFAAQCYLTQRAIRSALSCFAKDKGADSSQICRNWGFISIFDGYVSQKCETSLRYTCSL